MSAVSLVARVGSTGGLVRRGGDVVGHPDDHDAPVNADHVDLTAIFSGAPILAAHMLSERRAV